MTAPYEPPPPDSGLTPAQLAALLVLVQAQAAVRQQLTDAAIAAVVGPLRALGAAVWWDDNAYRKVIAGAVKIVQSSQRQAATVTDAYLTRAAKQITGKTEKSAGPIDVTKLRKAMTRQIAEDLIEGVLEPAWQVLGDTEDGPAADIDVPVKMAIPARSFVDPVEPYERVAENYRYQVVAEGVPEEQAREQAHVRLAIAVETDVTLAVRQQYHKTLGKQKAYGYRRILHPELAKFGHSCGLCVVAADRTYHIEELKPIHLRCNCEVLPIYKGADGELLDPGIELNYQELRSLYDAAGGTGKETLGKDGRMHSAKLKKLRVAIAEHGELGPTLVNADQNHRGPRKVAETKVDRPTRIRHQLDQLLQQHEITKYRAEQGLTKGNAVRWQASRIAELQRELAALS